MNTPSPKGAQDTIDALRDKLRQFADERDWDQFHSPMNLAMALRAMTLVESQKTAWPIVTRRRSVRNLGYECKNTGRDNGKLRWKLIEFGCRLPA